MRVGDDIELGAFSSMPAKSIGVRRFTQYLQDYFTQQRELNQHDGK